MAIGRRKTLTNLPAQTTSNQTSSLTNPMPQYGYNFGQPFGNPNEFTRSTGEDEINRFNQWMRSQPFYNDYLQSSGLANRGPDQGFSDRQQRDVEDLLRQQGINLPGAFHVDSGGNINQHNRLGRNLAIAAAAGIGGYYAIPALMSLGGAGTLASTPAAFTGTGFAPTVTSALGSGLGSGVGASVLPSTAATFTGAGFAPSITSGLGGIGGTSGGLAPLTSQPLTGNLAPYAQTAKSALQTPSWLTRTRAITKGLQEAGKLGGDREQLQQNQNYQQESQQQQQNSILPFSMQTPMFNQTGGFRGFNYGAGG